MLVVPEMYLEAGVSKEPTRGQRLLDLWCNLRQRSLSGPGSSSPSPRCQHAGEVPEGQRIRSRPTRRQA
jgi:hypothetical protein